MPLDLVKALKDRLQKPPIILLAKEPHGEDRRLSVQNFYVDGELVIPMFSSEAALHESTQGADLGLTAIWIKPRLLASILQGDEVFLLDPRLPSELRFTASEFRQAIAD